MGFRGINTDPIRNFKFRVNFQTSSAGFSRVSGLKETTEPVDYREGNEPGRPRKLFGQTTYDNVVLERGLTETTDLIIWRRQIVDVFERGQKDGFVSEGQATASIQADQLRRMVEIQLGDFHAEGGSAGAWSWSLIDAWPTSLEIGEFSGDGNEVVLETVELVHEGLKVKAPGLS
jgi:phage tail-like protein